MDTPTSTHVVMAKRLKRNEEGEAVITLVEKEKQEGEDSDSENDIRDCLEFDHNSDPGSSSSVDSQLVSY